MHARTHPQLPMEDFSPPTDIAWFASSGKQQTGREHEVSQVGIDCILVSIMYRTTNAQTNRTRRRIGGACLKRKRKYKDYMQTAETDKMREERRVYLKRERMCTPHPKSEICKRKNARTRQGVLKVAASQFTS